MPDFGRIRLDGRPGVLPDSTRHGGEHRIGIPLRVRRCHVGQRVDKQITHRCGDLGLGRGGELTENRPAARRPAGLADLRQRALYLRGQLGGGIGLLCHLSFEVGRQHGHAAFHHREQELVFTGEVAVEGGIWRCLRRRRYR
jgi:hypothetical protein